MGKVAVSSDLMLGPVSSLLELPQPLASMLYRMRLPGRKFPSKGVGYELGDGEGEPPSDSSGNVALLPLKRLSPSWPMSLPASDSSRHHSRQLMD